jgi:hypothetical protein
MYTVFQTNFTKNKTLIFHNVYIDGNKYTVLQSYCLFYWLNIVSRLSYFELPLKSFRGIIFTILEM